jgi:hypothetical protein
MHPNETQLVQQLRSPELSRGLLGFDQGETQQLLEEAAAALEAAFEARDRAVEQSRLAGLRAARAGPRPRDAEAVGRALLTATSAHDQLVTSGKEQADRLVARATAEADAIRAEAVEAREQLERRTADERAALDREREAERRRLAADREEGIKSARAEADRLLMQARLEVARLRRDAEEVALFLESKRSAFVETAGGAVEWLDRIERRAAPDEDLGLDRDPARSRSDASA